MTITVPNDPIEGWQKRLKAKIRKVVRPTLALFRKVMVHRQTLMFFFNAGFALFKLIKFIASIF